MRAVSELSLLLKLEHTGRAKHFSMPAITNVVFQTEGGIPVGGRVQPATCIPAPGEHPRSVLKCSCRSRGDASVAFAEKTKYITYRCKNEGGSLGEIVVIPRYMVELGGLFVPNLDLTADEKKSSC